MFPSHCKKISIFRCSVSKIPLLTNVFDDLQVILKVFDYNVLVKVDYGKLVGYALTQKENKKGRILISYGSSDNLKQLILCYLPQLKFPWQKTSS